MKDKPLSTFRFPRLSYLVMLVSLGFAGLPVHAIADETCPNGAQVDELKYCKYFAYYNNNGTPTDDRVRSALHVSKDDAVRSMALVVAISKYPNLSVGIQDLAAARNDGNNLEAFFVNNQKFDEVVVLRDADATSRNIEYFLRNYFHHRSEAYSTRGRFVFALSAHGVPPLPEKQGYPSRPGSIALSNASTDDDRPNLLDLTTLHDAIDALSSDNFHVLVLLNSCYGGGVFGSVGSGGDENDIGSPGARAITASGPDDLAYALNSNPKSGSVFFDTIIQGVTSGEADFFPPRLVFKDGHVQSGGGFIRFGALLTYLSNNLYILNAQNPDHPFKNAWAGSIEPLPMVAHGGFFFLSPTIVANSPATQVALNDAIKVERFSLPGRVTGAPIPISEFGLITIANATPTPASPVHSSPTTSSAVTFASPVNYPIQGIDVSHWSGILDWKVMTMAPGLRFVYMKATEGGSFHDQKFRENWRQARKAKLVVGAYHYVSFCANAEVQYSNIIATVPDDPTALPIALDLIDTKFSQQDSNGAPSREHACYKRLGSAGVRQMLTALIGALKAHYGKAPVIYTNRDASDLLDANFADIRRWVSSQDGQPPVGGSRWTIWQYATPRFGKFDLNVFFGSDKEFTAFQQGG